MSMLMVQLLYTLINHLQTKLQMKPNLVKTQKSSELEPLNTQVLADLAQFTAASDDGSSSIKWNVEDTKDHDSENDNEQLLAMDHMYGEG